MKAQWSYDSDQNCFPLPHEVFELGLEQCALLVYVYLVYHKSLKHSPNKLSCAIVSKAVGLCEKTVWRHLRTLSNAGLIQMERSKHSFSYALYPIWDKVQQRRSKEPFGRASPWSMKSGQCPPILTALATMRKETRLAAVPLTVNLL